MRKALDERRGDPIDVSLVVPPGRYVGGEESALVHWLGGGEALRLGQRRPCERQGRMHFARRARGFLGT